MTDRYFQLRPEYTSEVPLLGCPVSAGLGVLGRKWALPVLRSIAYHTNVRFSDILRNNAGLTPRALSLALKELQRAQLVERVRVTAGVREAFYDLTPAGRDVVPVLTALAAFSIKHLPHEVFADREARTLKEILPRSQRAMLGDLADYARGEAPDARALLPRGGVGTPEGVREASG